jgi:hypothetical protein
MIRQLKIGKAGTYSIFLFSEAMSTDGASFKVRKKLAEDLAKKTLTVLIYPSAVGRYRKIKLNENLYFFESPGLLTTRFRRGGFSIVDALFKSVLLILNSPDAVHATNGHRPAHLIPLIIGKILRLRTVFFDERWEAFYTKEWKHLRSGIIGKILLVYDGLLEKLTCRLYFKTICVTENLSNYLSCIKSVVAFPEIERNDVIDLSTQVKRYRSIFMSNLDELDHGDYREIIPVLQNIISKEINLVVTGSSSYIEKYFRPVFGENMVNLGWLKYNDYLNNLVDADIVLLPLEKTVRNNARWPIKINTYSEFGKTVLFSNHSELSRLNLRGFFEYHSDGELEFLIKECLRDASIFTLEKENEGKMSYSNEFRIKLLSSV